MRAFASTFTPPEPPSPPLGLHLRQPHLEAFSARRWLAGHLTTARSGARKLCVVALRSLYSSLEPHPLEVRHRAQQPASTAAPPGEKAERGIFVRIKAASTSRSISKRQHRSGAVRWAFGRAASRDTACLLRSFDGKLVLCSVAGHMNVMSRSP